jgi:hypothetical protein
LGCTNNLIGKKGPDFFLSFFLLFFHNTGDFLYTPKFFEAKQSKAKQARPMKQSSSKNKSMTDDDDSPFDLSKAYLVMGVAGW